MKPAFRRRSRASMDGRHRVSGLCKRCCTGTGKLLRSLQRCVITALPRPFVCEGAMNGETFQAYVEQFLAPTLKRGDIVFMDNVSVHKVDGVEQAIEARGAILFYLPAYSPDLNPIEQLFAKLKAMLRKIAAYSLKNSAFTIDSLCKAIASCLREISRSECAAFVVNSGYGQPNRETL